MAQPTSCDGHVGCPRLSQDNLRRKQWRRRSQGREEKGREEAVRLPPEFNGVLMEHPIFLRRSSPHSFRVAALLIAIITGEPTKRDRRCPGRRARRQSAPGDRADWLAIKPPKGGIKRWRRRLRAARRRRRRRDNADRQEQGVCRCAPPSFLYPRHDSRFTELVVGGY